MCVDNALIFIKQAKQLGLNASILITNSINGHHAVCLIEMEADESSNALYTKLIASDINEEDQSLFSDSSNISIYNILKWISINLNIDNKNIIAITLELYALAVNDRRVNSLDWFPHRNLPDDDEPGYFSFDRDNFFLEEHGSRNYRQ